MKAATQPVQRPRDARLLVVDAAGRIAHQPRARPRRRCSCAGDLVVANDAATLPASLAGRHLRERRGDRGAPRRPALARGRRRRALPRRRLRRRRLPHAHRGPRRAAAAARRRRARARAAARRPSFASLDHPRLVELRFAGDADAIRAGIARHGRPVQYAHVAAPLALWDVWTRDRGAAGRVRAAVGRLRPRLALLDRAARARHRLRDADPCGRPVVDRRRRARRAPAVRRAVPTCRRRRSRAIAAARARGDRVVALGTTVARALEHAAARPGGLARRRRHRDQPARPRDAARASSTRSSAARTSRASSHHELLRAFVDDATLARIDAALESARLPHARVRRLGAGRRATRALSRRART